MCNFTHFLLYNMLPRPQFQFATAAGDTHVNVWCYAKNQARYFLFFLSGASFCLSFSSPSFLPSILLSLRSFFFLSLISLSFFCVTTVDKCLPPSATSYIHSNPRRSPSSKPSSSRPTSSLACTLRRPDDWACSATTGARCS
jgi:hypothetical protein